jgi:hypothetical protein
MRVDSCNPEQAVKQILQATYDDSSWWGPARGSSWWTPDAWHFWDEVLRRWPEAEIAGRSTPAQISEHEQAAAREKAPRETTELASIDEPAADKPASFTAVKAAVEKRGPATEAELLKTAQQELAPKHVSRQQVRDARNELFGKPGRTGRPKSPK